jgi:hypothetical protein
LNLPYCSWVLSLKKIALKIFLILTLLLSVVIQEQLIFMASAQISELVISIRQDGSIDPSTAPIQCEGDVFTLASDVNCNTIIIQRDNIVFDGAHHTIELFGGISISDRENVTFKNAIIKAGLGISLSGSNSKIIGNTFHITATNAIAVYSVDSTVPSGNIISNNTIELKDGYAGVGVFKTSDTVISNNTIFTAEDSNKVVSGIIVTAAHNTAVVENNINAYSMYGIAVLTPYLDSSPQDEVFSGVVRENSIAGNYSYGVYSNCPNVDIIGNHITGELYKNPDSYGIILREDSNNNIVSQNYVANNGYGLCFQPFFNNTVSGSIRLSVFENSFVNNAVQAKINMSNSVIDWAKNQRGNYWSDYYGTDSNRDGIGDTSYVINGENVDNYPLMFPFDIENNTVVLPPPEPFPTKLVIASTITVAVVGIGLLFYFKKRKR